MYITQKFKIIIKSLKTILSIFFILLATSNGFSQTDNKDVSIIVSGSGKTQYDAKQSALRSSIEQAFGAFISSKTEMFNDQVVADQMASVSSGNIKSYEVLNESQLPDGSWGVTLKTIVSVDKLTSFVEAKGIAIEIKGGMFALNIKQQLLNEQGEIKAISEMVGLLHEPMQISFDYIIKSGEPKSLDAESKNWEMPLVVTANTNKNIDFCANYCIKTLTGLSLSSEEVDSYQSLNKDVFKVDIFYNGVTKTFYLRKQSSINVLYKFLEQWDFYTSLFTVESEMGKLNGSTYDYYSDYINYSREYIYKFSDRENYEKRNLIINFLTTGQHVATILIKEKRSLSEIEQISGYKVKPRGVVSQFKHGGVVVYEENGHGLIAEPPFWENLNITDWISAKNTCDDLILNGYSDWRLPTKEELKALNMHLRDCGIPVFFDGVYWSSNEYDNDKAWGFSFNLHKEVLPDKNENCIVRAVRTF